MDIEHSDVYEKLIASAIRFVSYRLRSEQEIRDFLSRKLTKNHISAPEICTRVIKRMTELGYVNDQEFVMWWVSQRTGRSPKGAHAIRAELLRKGVSADLIDTIIGSAMLGERSERSLATAAIRKKMVLWQHLPLLVKKRKMSEYLMRRGFSSDIVWSVVDATLSTV